MAVIDAPVQCACAVMLWSAAAACGVLSLLTAYDLLAMTYLLTGAGVTVSVRAAFFKQQRAILWAFELGQQRKDAGHVVPPQRAVVRNLR